MSWTIKTPKNISAHTSSVLDLYRALAAGLVVLFHARVYALNGTVPSDLAGAIAYSVTNCGTQAVFWFFVISGYLVGGSALADIQAGRFSFKHYAINRLSRLYIVLVPALLLGALLDSSRVATVGLNAHAGFETAASLHPATFIGNLLFLQTIFVPTFGSNYALWSIANEFWYYAIFPMLLAPLMTNKTRWVRAILFTCAVLLLLVMLKLNISMAWGFVFWCIGVGCRICPFRPIKSERAAALLAVAAMMAFPYLHPVIGPAATLLVVATFATVLLASHGNRSLSWRYESTLKVLGGFSFSLYAIHLVLQHYFLTMPRHNADPFLSLDPYSLAAILTIAALVIGSYLVAFVFSIVTERNTPWLRQWLVYAFDRLKLARG